MIKKSKEGGWKDLKSSKVKEVQKFNAFKSSKVQKVQVSIHHLRRHSTCYQDWTADLVAATAVVPRACVQ